MKLNRIALTFALAATALAAPAAEVKLRILETTDLHMNLLAYDYYRDVPTDQYGLARTITLIKAARAEAPNSLLFDNVTCCRARRSATWSPKSPRCATARCIRPTG